MSKAAKWRFFQGEYRGNSVEKQVIQKIEREEERAALKARLQAELAKDEGQVEWTAVRLAAQLDCKAHEVRAMIRRLGLVEAPVAVEV